MYQEAVEYSDRAIKILNKALEQAPMDSIVWIHKGDISKALGNKPGSNAAYVRAKELPEQFLDESGV